MESSHSHPKPKPTCTLLDVLPLEIRRLIYQKLLTSSNLIFAGNCVERKRNLLIVSDNPHPNLVGLRIKIDAAILRTCRQAYKEGLPILYQENGFIFTTVKMIEVFKSTGLLLVRTHGRARGKGLKRTPVFLFIPQPQGRLSLVRNMRLIFEDRPLRDLHYDEFDENWSSPWKTFLFRNRFVDRQDYIAFPSLEHLRLDFSKWKLRDHERVACRPLVDKFRGPKGLKVLEVEGIENRENLREMRRRLVAEDGEMCVLGLGDQWETLIDENF